MADEKISQLDPVTDVLDDDDYVVARAGESKRITGASLKAEFGGSSAPFAYMNLRGDGHTYTLNSGGGTRSTHAAIFDAIVDQDGSGITWDQGAPDQVNLVAGWYTLLFNDGWNAQDDDVDSLWNCGFDLSNGGGAGFQATSAFAELPYMAGGVWQTLVNPPFKMAADGLIRVTIDIFHLATEPSDYSPELSIVRLA